jgi:hypothetical protein
MTRVSGVAVTHSKCLKLNGRVACNIEILRKKFCFKGLGRLKSTFNSEESSRDV